jgi:putative Ca2+/H+ antiporter (TMEM165/GDT1 family)
VLLVWVFLHCLYAQYALFLLRRRFGANIVPGKGLVHLGVTMDWKLLLTVFATVFIAELGDKTQLATLLFAADKEVSKWLVFAGASLALIATSAIGVAAGGLVAEFVKPQMLSLVAGIGFVAIGIWTLYNAL